MVEPSHPLPSAIPAAVALPVQLLEDGVPRQQAQLRARQIALHAHREALPGGDLPLHWRATGGLATEPKMGAKANKEIQKGF